MSAPSSSRPHVAAEKAIAYLAPPATPRKWIRFAGPDTRWHAVYREANGGYFLYCSRFFEVAVVAEACAHSAMARGARRCGCCRSRIRCPYLLPATKETSEKWVGR
jgi:hypothetical protein